MFVLYILDSDVLPPATELPEGTDIPTLLDTAWAEKRLSSFGEVSQLLNIVFQKEVWSKMRPIKHVIFQPYKHLHRSSS